MRRLRCSLVALAAAAAAAACGQAADDTSTLRSSVVYGDDDRKDVFEVDGELREIASRSIVSIFNGTLDESDPSNVRVLGESVGRRLNLCKEERFWTDPAAAECSGTLIADDLVLTAGHCFKRERFGPRRRDPAEVCESRRFVFGYYNEAPERLNPITADDVFRCAELLVHRDDINEPSEARSDGDAALDFALVRLDRPATPRYRPVKLRVSPPVLGQALTVLGFPSGMPLKVAGNATILSIHESGAYFDGTTDTFAGNSGSGVFDATTFYQVGVLIAGQPDYERKGPCSVIARCEDTGCSGKSERIHQIRPILAEYCQRADARREVCQPPRPLHRLFKR